LIRKLSHFKVCVAYEYFTKTESDTDLTHACASLSSPHPPSTPGPMKKGNNSRNRKCLVLVPDTKENNV
jgi:hypothetical protein